MASLQPPKRELALLSTTLRTLFYKYLQLNNIVLMTTLLNEGGQHDEEEEEEEDHEAPDPDDVCGLFVCGLLLEQDLTTDLHHTPLTSLCETGNAGMMSVLLDYLRKKNRLATTIDKVIRGGRTGLFVAAAKGKQDCVALLLKAGANHSLANNNGATPLFMSCQDGHVEIASLLLEKGANINQAKNDGATPLFMSCYMGHVCVVKLLLAKGADVNHTPPNRPRPIALAAKLGHEKCLEALLVYNADAAPFQGFCPIQVAAAAGHEGCASAPPRVARPAEAARDEAVHCAC